MTMLEIFRGKRPDLTAAQVAAGVVAGVPAIATLLSAFGITELSQEQQDALAGVLTWCAVLAGLLIGGDATLRTARNVVDARRDTAAMMAGAAVVTPAAATPTEMHDPDVDDHEGTVRVSDEEEFGGLAGSVNGHAKIDDPDGVAVDE
jgi:hypothetical protein